MSEYGVINGTDIVSNNTVTDVTQWQNISVSANMNLSDLVLNGNGTVDQNTLQHLSKLDDNTLMNVLGLDDVTLQESTVNKLLGDVATYTDLLPANPNPIPSVAVENVMSDISFITADDVSQSGEDQEQVILQQPQQETPKVNAEVYDSTLPCQIETNNVVIYTTDLQAANPQVPLDESHILTTINNLELYPVEQSAIIVSSNNPSEGAHTLTLLQNSPQVYSDTAQPIPIEPIQLGGDSSIVYIEEKIPIERTAASIPLTQVFTEEPQRQAGSVQEESQVILNDKCPRKAEEDSIDATERKKPRGRRGQQQKPEVPSQKPPRKRRPRKVKLYEQTEPFEDAEQERKRKNAINAKKNRDEKKKSQQQLDEEVKQVKMERDKLAMEVKMLKEREENLRKELLEKFGVTLPL